MLPLREEKVKSWIWVGLWRWKMPREAPESGADPSGPAGSDGHIGGAAVALGSVLLCACEFPGKVIKVWKCDTWGLFPVQQLWGEEFWCLFPILS